MLPGCRTPLPQFKEGAIVAVFVRGNPAAVVRLSRKSLLTLTLSRPVGAAD